MAAMFLSMLNTAMAGAPEHAPLCIQGKQSLGLEGGPCRLLDLLVIQTRVAVLLIKKLGC